MPYLRAVLAVAASFVTLLGSAQERKFLNPVSVPTGIPVNPYGTEPVSTFVADFDRDGVNDLLVATATMVRMLPGNRAGSFGSASTTTIPAGIGIKGVADFNHDGIADLYGSSSSSQIAIMLGDGKGRFAGSSTFRAAYGDAQALVAGYFDDDRFLDLAVVASTALRIYSGNGRGGLTLTVVAAGTLAPTIAAATGDYNGDGWLDVAAVTARGASIFFNQRGLDYALVQLPEPGVAVASGDFDGDGIVDLAIAKASSSDRGTVSTMIFGDRNTEQFGRARAAIEMRHVAAMHTGDFDRNGIVDLAMLSTRPHLGIVTVGRNRKPEVRLHFAGLPRESSAIGDLNSDGLLDVATTSTSEPGVANLVLGNGDGTMRAYRAIDTALTLGSEEPLPLDVDGDGFTDLAGYSATGIAVQLSDRAGFYRREPVITPFDLAYPVLASVMAADDLDHDGRDDLILTRRQANDSSSVTWTPLFGQADGSFRSGAAMSDASPSTPSTFLAVGDLTGDGHADLLFSEQLISSERVYIHQGAISAGDGRGNFEAPFATDLPLYPGETVRIVDLNADGRGELLVRNGDFRWLFVNEANDRFVRLRQIDPYEVTADMNGDGALDLVNVRFFGVTLMNGTQPIRSYNSRAYFNAPSYPSSGRTADFDGDGHVDIGTERGIAFGAGDGTIRSLLEYRTVATAIGVAARGAGSNPALLLSYNGVVAAIAPSEPPGTAISQTTLTSSENPTVAGRDVEIEARVMSGTTVTPRGAVRFEADGETRLTTLSATGSARLRWRFSTAPTRLTVTYLGDERFAPSSAEYIQTATPASTRLVPGAHRRGADGSFAPESIFDEGDTIYLDAFVVSRFSARNPTVAITVREGEKIIGLLKPQSFPVANRLPVAASSLGPGRHVLDFHWPGDADRLASAETLVVYVNSSGAAFMLSTEPTLLVVGSAMTVTAAFSAAESVAFFLDELPLGEAQVIAGKASMTLPAPRWGAGFLRAEARDGSGNFAASRVVPILIYLGAFGVRPELRLRSLQLQDNGGSYRATVEISPIVGAINYAVTGTDQRFNTPSYSTLPAVKDGVTTFTVELSPNERYLYTVRALDGTFTAVPISIPLVIEYHP